MELYANLTACIIRLHQLLHSAAPREITAIIKLGFASCDYCINLHSAAPRAINSVIALYAVRLAQSIKQLPLIPGLPCGKEGPMIHSGAALGAGIPEVCSYIEHLIINSTLKTSTKDYIILNNF